jgi:hypothetical protein
VHDLISFTKSITEDTIQYMRKFFEQNFAMYSILSVYENYNISIASENADSGEITYKIESIEDGNSLNSFITYFNGSMIPAYGNMYLIHIDAPIENILNIHLTKILP